MTDSWDLPGSLSDILDASLGEAPVAHMAQGSSVT